MVTDLLVQRAQRLEHVVVQVAAKHERQDHAAQRLGRAIEHRTAGRNHTAFHPGKTLPLAALHQQILFQGIERDHAGARIAIGAQCQVHAEHKAVFGGVTDQGVHAFDGAGEILLARDFVAAFAVALRLAVFVVHINQVDVARHVQLAGTELAHADDPHLGTLAIGFGGGTMQGVQVGHDLLPSDVEGDFGQPSHASGDAIQRGLLGAVELGQTLQRDLAQNPKRCTGVQTRGRQGLIGGLQALPTRDARGQHFQDIAISTLQTLHKPRIKVGTRQVRLRGIQDKLGRQGGTDIHRWAAGHNSC